MSRTRASKVLQGFGVEAMVEGVLEEVAEYDSFAAVRGYAAKAIERLSNR